MEVEFDSRESTDDLFRREVEDSMADLEKERSLQKKPSDFSIQEVGDITEKQRSLEEKSSALSREEVEDIMVDLKKERSLEEKSSALSREEVEDSGIDLEKEKPLEEKPLDLSREEVKDAMIDLEKERTLMIQPSDILEKEKSLEKKPSDLSRAEMEDITVDRSLLNVPSSAGNNAKKVMQVLKVPILAELVKRFKFGDNDLAVADNKTLAVMKTNLQSVCNIISNVMEGSSSMSTESQGLLFLLYFVDV